MDNELEGKKSKPKRSLGSKIYGKKGFGRKVIGGLGVLLLAATGVGSVVLVYSYHKTKQLNAEKEQTSITPDQNDNPSLEPEQSITYSSTMDISLLLKDIELSFSDISDKDNSLETEQVNVSPPYVTTSPKMSEEYVYDQSINEAIDWLYLHDFIEVLKQLKGSYHLAITPLACYFTIQSSDLFKFNTVKDVLRIAVLNDYQPQHNIFFESCVKMGWLDGKNGVASDKAPEYIKQTFSSLSII